VDLSQNDLDSGIFTDWLVSNISFYFPTVNLARKGHAASGRTRPSNRSTLQETNP
jgi:hypothetical protein